jgi:hypothetical protein
MSMFLLLGSYCEHVLTMSMFLLLGSYCEHLLNLSSMTARFLL